MKPRDFLNFLKTKSGKLVVFGCVFAAGLVIFSALRKHHSSTDEAIAVVPLSINTNDNPQVVQSITRPIQLFNPPLPKPEPTLKPVPVTNSISANPSLPVHSNLPPRQSEILAPISLFADSTAGSVRPKKLSATYAPFGRLIPCETIITVDSASMETPIVGLVTENIYYGDG
jgi:hypothetical protein